jgi:transposase InsO family protein
MTQAERDRLVALKKAAKGLITRRQAAAELKISEREVYRLLAGMRERGDKAVIHGLRGRPSSRKLDGEVEEKAIAILRDPKLRDYGPTLASQYMRKKHHISVSKETMRKWMVGAGLWQERKERVEEVHLWRARRERFGELVQWDTSEHDWLEGRGELRYLVTLIDDATSRIFARFVRQDSTAANMAVLEEYLRRFGRPLEFYTDKASIFHTTPKKNHAVREEPLPPTQIGRALQELGIGWIAAHSPQAKGRVERSFQTAQDRLVKLMRAEGITTLEEANVYLDNHYLPEWESLFTRAASCAEEAHRPLGKQHKLEAILCRVEQRVVTNDYTFRLGAQIYQIERQQARPRLRGASVRVEHRRNEEVAVRFEDRYLNVSECEAPAAKTVQPKASLARARSDPAPTAGGKSQWMKGFWERKAPSLKQAITISNATS